ncbi:MAG: hypothetical protein H3C26_16210 [Rhodocyclaceae bacterium]|nr:hypothetical protein [Rhodocyclaceae bacterium]
MAQFSLTPDPTFTATVEIPVPGKKPAKIDFTFKHRDREQFGQWFDALRDNESDVDVVLDIASGWNLKEPFGRETVEQLVTGYLGSARSIIDKYIAENTGARLGNLR